MPRVVTKLSPNKSGGFTARKRLPKDVQTDYERLYGIRWEERFNSESVPFALAKAKHREWLSEIEGRIANIRAERSGDGQRLTPMQARALAGEWYLWFTERHLAKPSPADHWEDYLGEVGDTINDELRPHGDATNPEEEDPDVVWRRYPDARRVVRPMLADWGETSRFLAARRIALDSTSRDLFLDCLYGDFAAALKLLIQRRRGDYTPDARPTRFPQFERSPDPGVTPWGLFEQWIEKTKPAISTVDRWRGVFVRLREDFPDRSAASLSQDEIRDWVGGLINGTRSPVTVREVWVAAGRTVYAWAKDQNIVSRNPFAELRVPVPRKTKSRETKAFHSTEIKTILSAALAVPDISRKSNAAKRWVPWICAYTGARSGEITQLRGADIIERDGIRAIRITPDAGTTKTGTGRVVPIHAHLIKQGFLAHVKANGQGPLFYNQQKGEPKPTDATNPSKPRYVKARESLATWVRSLGITDPELQPNHAWRHTFKQIADRCGISEKVSDAITGHAPATVSRGYGPPTLSDMAAALKKFPRYKW